MKILSILAFFLLSTLSTNGQTDAKEISKYSISAGAPLPFIAPLTNFGFALYRSLYNNFHDPTVNYNPPAVNYSDFQAIYTVPWKMDEPSSVYTPLEFSLNNANGTSHRFTVRVNHYKFISSRVTHFGGGINQLSLGYTISIPSKHYVNLNFEFGAEAGIMLTIPTIHSQAHNWTGNQYAFIPNGKVKILGYDYAGLGADINMGLSWDIAEKKTPDWLSFQIWIKGGLNVFTLNDFKYEHTPTKAQFTMEGFENVGVGFMFGGKTVFNFGIRETSQK